MLVELQSAMARMREALDLLDSAGAPANVGAHLDLAICRLRDVICQIDHRPDGSIDVAIK